jgi:hypothetical protein
MINVATFAIPVWNKSVCASKLATENAPYESPIREIYSWRHQCILFFSQLIAYNQIYIRDDDNTLVAWLLSCYYQNEKHKMKWQV